jgi:hypothetical protein
VEVSRLATHANCKIEISVIAVCPPPAKRRQRTTRSKRKTARRK